MTERSWWGAALLGRGADDEVWAYGSEPVTFARLREQTEWQAQALTAHGIRAEDTVALHGSTAFTQLWVVMALWSIGAQVVLLDPRLARGERSALLEVARPRYEISFRAPRSRADAFVDECEVLVRPRRSGRRMETGHCVVQFSSGTTGGPKAVGRTSESLLTEIDRLAMLEGMPRAGERVLVMEPVSHSFGLIGGVLYGLEAAAPISFPADQRPDAIIRAAADARVLIGNPRHYDVLAQAPDGFAMPDLRVAVSGGDSLAEATARTFRRRYGVGVGQAYGTTETGIVAADIPGRLDLPFVGTPVPGVRVRIVDGVLEVHVPHSPYLYRARSWTGGWMSTRDLASLDPKTGALRLRGRFPGTGPGRGRFAAVDLLELESLLRGHAGVADAVVVAIDPLELHVAGTDGLDQRELESRCHHFLGDDSIPIHCHVVRELPRTPSGKAVRDRLRLLGAGAATRAPRPMPPHSTSTGSSDADRVRQ